jgi:hypothetical protein
MELGMIEPEEEKKYVKCLDFKISLQIRSKMSASLLL